MAAKETRTGIRRWGVIAAVGIYAGYMYYNVRDAARKQSLYEVSPYKLALCRFVPLNGMTWLAGKFAAWQPPVWLRAPLYGLYAFVYGCEMDESEQRLEDFATFNEFFTRSLKPGFRPIDGAELVSPADGRILAFGQLPDAASREGSRLFPEQVKGVSYPLDRLLGVTDAASIRPTKAGNRIFYCSIYLAPGSYHRFHSPASLKIEAIRRISGEALPVAPWILRLMPGLVNLNERAVLQSSWQHGAFWMVPVGATNVKSISLKATEGQRMMKGGEMGQFEMGSLVLLIFEAPRDFEWSGAVGSSVKYGQPLGSTLGGSHRWRFWPF